MGQLHRCRRLVSEGLEPCEEFDVTDWEIEQLEKNDRLLECFLIDDSV